jgi:DNA cross-link repair 1A protein
MSGPGSCLLLFEGPQTINAGDSAFKSAFVGSARIFRYLHCGDFRASPQHVLHPAIKGKKIDHVYLDTTYLDPKVYL